MGRSKEGDRLGRKNTVGKEGAVAEGSDLVWVAAAQPPRGRVHACSRLLWAAMEDELESSFLCLRIALCSKQAPASRFLSALT